MSLRTTGLMLAACAAVVGLIAGRLSGAQHGHPQVYSPPAGPPPSYDRGSSAVDIPIELSSNHIYLRVRLGEGPPAQMILDTGGGASAFDPDMVRAAGIELGTPVRAMGAGGETRDAWLLSGRDDSDQPGVCNKAESVPAPKSKTRSP